MISSTELRAKIQDFLEQRQWIQASLHLGDLWRQDAKSATASYILGCYDRLRPHLTLVPCKIALLRSMTVEPVLPVLKASALVSGIDPSIQLGEFNAYTQEILDPESSLYRFDPGIAILAVQTRDILPELWEGGDEFPNAKAAALCDRVAEKFSCLIRAFRSHCSASLIVHTFEQPRSKGLLEVQESECRAALIGRLNRTLRDICHEQKGVYTLDYDSLVSQHGRSRWHDEVKWLTMRMPFAADSLPALAFEWLKFIHPLTGTICKVAVVDLDNTLWGGVLGEDGVGGLRLGTEYPGAFYLDVQRALREINRRGVLLAICSKNSHDEAMAVLREHPGMLLRPEDFSAVRINWQDKPQNLREIAQELNLSTDALAFVDDSPAERARMRSEMPSVRTIDLPGQPREFARAIYECPLFERLSLSAEEQDLTRLYRERRERVEFANKSESLQDFYESLEQEVSIAPVSPANLLRAAQLTQKTNQFNLTTHRYSEQLLQSMVSRPDCSVFTVRVRDRFGDNGDVGVIIVFCSGDTWEIDTFALSCRVIHRTIEAAVLAFLVNSSKTSGAQVLQGWFIPTEKNIPARDFYEVHGFEPAEFRGGATLWRMKLTDAEVECPRWIRLRSDPGQRQAEVARA